jgi:serine/threonine protein kinase
MFEIGQLIDDRYLVRARKKGGMGYVFICDDQVWLRKGRPLKVALKTMLPELQRVRGATDRFLNEARLWVELGKHPNILHALYVKRIQDQPFVIMEFIQGYQEYGPDLEGWINSKKMPLEKILDFSLQFCDGMIYASECFAQKGLRFVHRDVKPGNTMIDNRLQVKITDFGLAKIMDESPGTPMSALPSLSPTSSGSLTLIGGIMGTPRYMSPEQCRGETNIDIRSDVYAFGCMLFEMLTGNAPFPGKDIREIIGKHLSETPPPLMPVPAGASDRLKKIVLRCLQKQAASRFPDFSALREELVNEYCAATGRKREVAAGPQNAPRAGLGDKLNKSLSLYELGQKDDGVRLFAEAIGEKKIAADSPVAPKANQGIEHEGRRLVRGGLISKDQGAPGSPNDKNKA